MPLVRVNIIVSSKLTRKHLVRDAAASCPYDSDSLQGIQDFGFEIWNNLTNRKQGKKRVKKYLNEPITSQKPGTEETDSRIYQHQPASPSEAHLPSGKCRTGTGQLQLTPLATLVSQAPVPGERDPGPIMETWMMLRRSGGCRRG